VAMLNPFRRASYLLYTSMTHDDAGNGLLKSADRYNQSVKERCVVATTRGDTLTARVEPFTIGRRGTGKWMNYFLVEAKGEFLPAHDGGVRVTLAMQRSVSATQIIWRLFLVAVVAAAVSSLVRGTVIFPLGVSAALLMGATVLPWSFVAYVAGMRQAGRDWQALLEVFQTGLHSQTLQRV
jgi:hypothetical protein